MSDAFRTLIVPADMVDTARTIAASWGPAGEGMWTTGLEPIGAEPVVVALELDPLTGETEAIVPEPPTHYVSTGYIGADVAHMVPCQTWEQDEDGAWVMTGAEPGDADALKAWLDEQGVPVSMTDIMALYAEADVTEQEPFTAFGRLGVQLVRSDEEVRLIADGFVE